MPCADALRVQAYFDAELDALSAADVERHCETCAECRELLEDLRRTRIVLRRDLPYESAPPALRARIMQSIDQESALESSRVGETRSINALPASGPTTSVPTAGAPKTSVPPIGVPPIGVPPIGVPTAGGPKTSAPPIGVPTAGGSTTRGRLAGGRLRPFWAGAFSGVAGTAIAAGMAFFLLAPPVVNPLLETLVSAHVRSLMPEHLIDVVSTDKHTVKPWFAGHTDVSPVVADFDSEGYRLIGGRADYLDHQSAAVVVYQHGPHVINVFSWAADQRGVPKDSTRNGYHLAFWRAGNLEYCAVSDTSWEELTRLAKLLQNTSAVDAR